VIEDDGFIGKIYDDNKRLGQYISFNAFENGEHGPNISEKVELEKTADNKVKIKLKNGENAKISWIEIFYNQSVRDNIGEEEWNKYRNGQEVTASNTATGQMPGLGPTETGTGTRTGQKKVEADKKYNSQDHIQVIGSSDKEPRVLNWNIGLTNDNGFGNNTALNDVLQQDSENGGKHYITPGQASSFRVFEGTTDIPSTAYTITFYDKNGNEIPDFANGSTNAEQFKVEFNNTIDSSYKHLSIAYSTTADVSGVRNGYTAHFDNTYQYGSPEYKTTNGLEFERDDPHNVKNIKLSINKTWDDRNNKFNTRPEKFKVQIWRAEVDENGNCPAANDELAWTRIPEAEIANSAEYEISSSQQGAYRIPDEFPQWYVKEPGEVIVRYCYKVVEVPDDSGYVLTHVSSPFIAEYDNTFDLKNKKDLDVIKIAVDKDGKPINSADLSTVPKAKVDIDGTPTDCYIFGWEIFFKDGHVNYTDTLPTGAKYINIDPDYGTKVIYDDFGNSWGIQDWNMTISQNDDELSIRITDSRVKSVRYFTAIPKDKIEDALDPDRKLINKVEDNTDHKEYTGTLNVTNDAPDDVQHLKKEAIPDKHRVGVIHYSLDVNPTGKKMSNEDYITITDAVQIDADSSHANDLKFALDSIAVYPCDENGQVDKSHPIENYSYTVDYDYEDSSNLSFSDMKDGKMNNNAIKYWVVNGWEHGKNITITVPKNPDYTKDQSNLNLVIFKNDNPNTDNIATSSDVIANQFSDYDSNGNATITLKVPDDATKIVVTSGFEEKNATTPISGFNIAENGVTATSGGSPLTVSYEGDNASNDGNQYRYWEITGWNPGDTVELNAVLNPVFMPIFETDPNTSFDQIRYSIYENTYNLTNFYNPSPKRSDDDYNFKDSKTWTVTVPAGAQHLFVFSKYINKSDYKVRNYSSIGGLTGVSKSDPVPALLNVDVPDQQHVRVEYTYRVSGTTTTDNIFLTNTASFEADNGSGWDRANHNQLTVKSSGAISSTNTNPNIYKADVNNYSLNTLEASFKVAKWDETNGRWVYASEVKDITIDDQPVRKFVFPTENVSGYLETVSGGKHYAPVNAAVLKFAKTDDPSIPSNETVHEFKLDDEALYKFVEIESPQNYRQVNASGSLEENSEFVFYYAYNGYTGSTPDDAMADGKSKIRNISAGNNINIPNSQFISIKAQKSFTGTDIPGTAEVKLGLYYSTNRNGKNLTAVTADMVDGNDFENPKTLTYNKTGNAPVVTWEGLPSGINGSPVYYFVKEESCTYGGETYKRDRADDKLKRETDGEACLFQPVYTRNGTNKDGTVIEVNNSQGIAVKKIWQKSDGTLISNPNLSIQYEVYGIKGSEKPLLYYSGTLSSANGFQQILPQSNDDGRSLSEFDTFEVKEINPPEGWTTSTTRKLENGTGTLEIINTQEVVETTTNISVKKVWDMNGSTQNHPSSVNVKLIQSLDSIAPGNVTESNGVATPDFGECTKVAEQTLNEDNGWEFTWNNLPKKNAEDKPYFYYVIEKSNYPGYTVSYSLNNQGTLTTITNTFKKVDLKVNKLWAGDDNKDHSGETIKFVIKRSTDPNDVPNNGTTVGEEQEIFVPEKTVTVIASASEVYQGATINLSAKFGNDDVTDSAVFYVDGNQIDERTFTSNEVGDHTVKAKYLDNESQEITVTVKTRGLTLNNNSESVDVNVGSSVQLTPSYTEQGAGTPNVVNYSSADDSIATVDENGNVTGIGEGTTTISATDSYGNTDEISVVVSEVINDPYTFYLHDISSSSPLELIKGNTYTIIADETINKLTASSRQLTNNYYYNATISEDNDHAFKIEVLSSQQTNIESGWNEKIYINDDQNKGIWIITKDAESGSGGNSGGNENQNVVGQLSNEGKISIPGTIQSGKYFVATISGPANQDLQGCLGGNTNSGWQQQQYAVTTDSEGNATIEIKANYDYISGIELQEWNKKSEITLVSYQILDSVEQNYHSRFNPTLSETKFFTPYQAAAPTLTSARSKRPLRGGNITKTVGAEALENEVTELFFNTNVSDIIELGAGKTPSTMMNVSIVGGKVKLKANKQGAGDTDSEWTKTINGLPATDENNNPYYYWIEEVDVAQDYTASYTDNRVDAVNTGGNAEITITNTKKNDTGVELPISGGSGLNTIYTIGAVLLMMSGAGYTMYRRRRWYDE